MISDYVIVQYLFPRILAIILLLIFRKQIFTILQILWDSLFLEPIRGGNGKTQLDELAKYAIIVITVIEAANPHSDNVKLGELLTFTATIAGLQKHFKTKQIIHGKDESGKTEKAEGS